MRFTIWVTIILTILISSCRKEERITTDPSAKLSFTQDTLLFDTIFSSIGSITKRIKVINPNKNAVNIAEIKLAGGASSSFTLNITGESATFKNNLIVNGGDSLNIFVKATINPKATALPFLVQDSIIFTCNGNRKALQILAYGQNAVFVNNSNLSGNIIWTNTLPYIITGNATLTNNSTLTISPGTKVYFHKDAGLEIQGTLNINGTSQLPVLLCSDRLENIYSEQPGQWQGIHLKQSGHAVINYALIKNASVGITSDSLSQNTSPKLVLANTIIKNMEVAAFIGYHSELSAFNSLMYNCGNYIIYAIGGGNYNLKQNTFAGYNPTFPRKNAALSFSNYLSAKAYHPLQLNLSNNIIWGMLTNELDIETKNAASLQANIQNNAIRTVGATFNNNNNIINTDPQFLNWSIGNFELSNSSAMHEKGINLSADADYSTYLNKDMNGTARSFPSSLGCYQKK